MDQFSAIVDPGHRVCSRITSRREGGRETHSSCGPSIPIPILKLIPELRWAGMRETGPSMSVRSQGLRCKEGKVRGGFSCTLRDRTRVLGTYYYLT